PEKWINPEQATAQNDAPCLAALLPALNQFEIAPSAGGCCPISPRTAYLPCRQCQECPGDSRYGENGPPIMISSEDARSVRRNETVQRRENCQTINQGIRAVKCFCHDSDCH